MTQSIVAHSKVVKPLVKVTIYCRVSSLMQIDGYGLQRQQDVIRSFIDNFQVPHELGYEIDRENYEVLEDQGKSAYHGYNFTKGQLGIFRDKVLRKEITSGLMIIENVDRFTRMEEYLAMQEFNNLILGGIDILEVETGEIFSKKINGSLTKLSVSIARAYSESKRKSNISKRSWMNRKRKSLEDGVAINNNTPDWLNLSEDKKYYIVDADKVALINYVFNSYVEGLGATNIIKRLNDQRKYLSDTPWSTNKIYHLLSNKRVTGYLGDERHYPQIVEPGLYDQVQELLKNKTRKRRKAGTLMRSLFNGIAKCTFCGNGMIGHNMSSAVYLRCIAERSKTTECKKAKLIRYNAAERLILEHIRNVDWAAHKQEQNDNKNDLSKLRTDASILESEIADVVKELETADDDLVMPLAKLVKKRRGELQELNEKISTLEGSFATPDMSLVTDIDSIQDQENVTLRQSVYLLLSKTVSTINCARYDWDETYYIFELKYIGAEQKHVLICNKTLEKKYNVVIHKRGETTIYETYSFKIEATPEMIKIDVPQSIVINDYFLLLNYIDSVNGSERVAQWMRDKMVDVLRQAYS